MTDVRSSTDQNRRALDTAAEHQESLRTAVLIRRFEERLLSLFSEGRLNGTVHTCIGQEWTAVAVMSALTADDSVCSTHRGHGHFLARTGDVAGLMAEIMGKSTGVCGGIGGSQHLHAKNYYSSGIQGGMAPIAAGLALGEKLADTGNISAVIIGDGTLGEGVLYEVLNIASRWEIPLIVVVENNGYAQSTSCAQTLAGSVKDRAAAFDISYFRANTWDWQEVLAIARTSVGYVRQKGRPAILEIETYRLKAHSKGDDNRDPEEIASFEERDFLSVLLKEMPAGIGELVRQVDAEIDAAVKQAEEAPDSDFSGLRARAANQVSWSKPSFDSGRVSEIIYETLRSSFEKDSRLVMIGEDIEGEYGGAFKVTRDLSQRFPSRVWNTPISEAAITGIGSGLALGGWRPVVEIMFGDFLTLTFDQLLQHAVKFSAIFDGKVDVPLVVRTPMGGKRGYGPTHSQSIEKHFLGIPDLDVLALNVRVSPKLVYERLFASVSRPTLVVENKILYTRFLHTDEISGFSVWISDEVFPTVRISPVAGTPDVTIVCYGGTLEDVEQAIQLAFDDEEILCEVICPTQIHPLNINPIVESARVTGRLLTVEEGPRFAALGSEIVAQVTENGVRLKSVTRIGHDAVIPSSLPRELELLPSPENIVAAIEQMTDE